MLIKKNDGNSAEICAEFILNNELIIIPTDTVYGFSCLKNSEAEEYLIFLKGRSKEKKFISLISEPEEVLQFVKTPVFSNFLNLWSYNFPITLIFRNIKDNGTSAFRVPNDEWLLSVLRLIKKPILSTSVNYSGKPAMTNIGKIYSEFKDKISLIVDGGNIEQEASAIIDLSGKKPQILRQGGAGINLLSIL